jgi:hypothetical protein
MATGIGIATLGLAVPATLEMVRQRSDMMVSWIQVTDVA